MDGVKRILRLMRALTGDVTHIMFPEVDGDTLNGYYLHKVPPQEIPYLVSRLLEDGAHVTVLIFRTGRTSTFALAVKFPTKEPFDYIKGKMGWQEIADHIRRPLGLEQVFTRIIGEV